MPLWPVHLRPWTAGNIREVVPEEVLVDFEGPLTFTFRDIDGNPLLAHLLSRGGTTLRYVAAPTTDELVAQMRTGARSVRAALDQPLVWVIDVDPAGVVTTAWTGALADLPARVLPAADVMLYPHLAPMLRLRAVGDQIEPGLLPASVVSTLVTGAERAVRGLVRHAAGASGVGRPREWVRSLYQLQAEQFAFRSFEVAFRPTGLATLFAEADNDEVNVIGEAERLLRLGLAWASTGALVANDDAERRAIFDAIRELSPPQGSPITYVEVGGRVAGDVTTGRPRLTSGTRRLAGEAVAALQSGKPLPEYAARVGHVGAADVDARTLTVRNRDGEDTFDFEMDFLDEVLDALNTQEPVSTAAARIDDKFLLVSILPLRTRMREDHRSY